MCIRDSLSTVITSYWLCGVTSTLTKGPNRYWAKHLREDNYVINIWIQKYFKRFRSINCTEVYRRKTIKSVGLPSVYGTDKAVNQI